ncbi:hypothetical protein GUJ93_ZPchr0001g31618 [Zizania palustris]|uniref:Wall-associated receptor kinase galacturonan-binding domain-containing protein n=1 Tax=Zizania palustris TaxID=103762 RepID=A0A8J5RXZ8_ZIZPA|nr:hypothetical protein GUJ93_ZPchr0001g31618 [Zizania palustris]
MPLLLLCRRLLLLLLLVAASHGYAAGDTNGYDSSMCLKEPVACGNVSISYPFYLSSEMKDLNGYSSSYCGYPGLAIECNDGKTMMQLDGPYKYLVKNITYGSYGNDSYGNVSLADPVVLEDRSSCPKVDHNVTIPWFSWLYFPGMSVDYLVFFLDCSFTAPIVRPPATYQLTCGNIGAGQSFVLPKDKVPEYNIYYGSLSQACNKIIEVPVLSDNSGDSEWSTDEYGQVLRQGFQLAWNDSKRLANCTQCEQSNGRCGYNQGGDFIGCLCPDERVHSRNCSDDSGKPFVSSTSFLLCRGGA